jgi:hypothetical protein
LLLAAPAGAATPGQVVITEWMYNPTQRGPSAPSRASRRRSGSPRATPPTSVAPTRSTSSTARRSPIADRLTYGDQTFPGSIRTAGTSGIPTSCLGLGANNVGLWKLSQLGDGLGSRSSTPGDVGSPGARPLGACAPVTIVGGDGTGVAKKGHAARAGLGLQAG